MSKTANVVITLALLALVAVFSAWYLVRGSVSADLSVIGEGKPVAVLVYENYSPGSQENLARLNRVREDFAGEIRFRVATIGSPSGDDFIGRYDAPEGAFIVLDGDGSLLDATSMPGDSEALRVRLRAALDGREAAPEASGPSASY